MHEYLKEKTELDHGNRGTSQTIPFQRAAAADPSPSLSASLRVVKHASGQPKLIASSSYFFHVSVNKLLIFTFKWSISCLPSLCRAKTIQTGPESEKLSSMDLYLFLCHKLYQSLYDMSHIANILITHHSTITPS